MVLPVGVDAASAVVVGGVVVEAACGVGVGVGVGLVVAVAPF